MFDVVLWVPNVMRSNIFLLPFWLRPVVALTLSFGLHWSLRGTLAESVCWEAVSTRWSSAPLFFWGHLDPLRLFGAGKVLSVGQ